MCLLQREKERSVKIKTEREIFSGLAESQKDRNNRVETEESQNQELDPGLPCASQAQALRGFPLGLSKELETSGAGGT